MKKNRSLTYIVAGILVLVAIFFLVSYNGLVKKDEKVKLQWNEVQNAYQRRLDLVPNLVNTVKGGAEYEQNVLEQIAAARAKAIAMTGSGEANAADYNAQTQAQDDLAKASNRLLITVEKYPELQGTRAFRTLQTQLERTELRILMARKDFNSAIQDYNSSVRSFPTKIVAGTFGFKPKDGFTADAGAEHATEIKFK